MDDYTSREVSVESVESENAELIEAQDFQESVESQTLKLMHERLSVD